jgi:hypothetical protein
MILQSMETAYVGSMWLLDAKVYGILIGSLSDMLWWETNCDDTLTVALSRTP